MEFLLKQLSASLGKTPGELVYVGEREAQPTRIRVLSYNAEELLEERVDSADSCRTFLDRTDRVTWIDVSGLADKAFLARLGEILGVHALVLEDILNTGMRPRMEDCGDYLFVMLKMLYLRPELESEGLAHEQISLVLGPTWVVSFQEMESDCFDSVRERIRRGTARMRRNGADYLAYTLIDNAVDNYFRALEPLAECVDDLQEEALRADDLGFLRTTHALRREIIHVRRNLNPVREWLVILERHGSPLLSEGLKPYIRDAEEHCLHVLDVLDSLREMIVSVQDTHLTSMSNRMNNVMRMLTAIAAIFMPLSFVAGIYGMNFKHMPETEWKYGYFLVLGLMLALATGMLLFFRRKRWL